VKGDGKLGLLKQQQPTATQGHTTAYDTNKSKGATSLVSSMEMQVLFRKLRHKNSIRRELGIRQFHVPTVFKRKLRMTTEFRYNELLEPYLADVFGAVSWPIGFTPRLLLAVQLHDQATRLLRCESGIADPRTKKPDMLKIMETFAPDPDNNVTNFANHKAQS
jgi:hypothetical protein